MGVWSVFDSPRNLPLIIKFTESWLLYYNGIKISWLFYYTVYCHDMPVPLITCHQHGRDCFIRMLSINMACSITVYCHMSSTQCDCFVRMLSMHLDCSITVYCILCQSINSDCFWKPIKLHRTHPVNAESLMVVTHI